MENLIFITLTGQNHYLGFKPYKIGRIVRITKDRDNPADPEAIRAELPYIDTIGYVANSVNSVYDGTFSAGRIYDKIGDYAYAKIMFITHSGAICLLLSPEDVENESPAPPGNSKEETNQAGFLKPSPQNKIGFSV